MRVSEQHVAAIFRRAMPQELQQAFGVDGVPPGTVFLLEVVRRELDDQHFGFFVLLEVVVQREVAGHGQNGICNGYVAGFEPGFLADNRRIDAGHGRGVAVD